MYSTDDINSRMAHSLVAHLGIKITQATPSIVEATMDVDERTCQPMGCLHGGASLALAETLAGLGSMLIVAEDEYAVGTEVTGNHIAPAPLGTRLKAQAEIIHQGRSTHLWNVNICTEENGRLISTIRVLNSIIKKNPAPSL